MPYVNSSYLYRIPRNQRTIMVYYPDIVLFELNQTQYTDLWQRLSSHKYLYTNGYKITPTNWFTHAFQTIKGWLGFENYCQREKIEYTLNKLAYYGYTKNFQQPDFSKLQYYSLSKIIVDLTALSYTDSTTDLLQRTLLQSYYEFEPHLGIQYTGQFLSTDHPFGKSWILVDAVELIPQMDPQDSNFINSLIQAIDQKGYAASEIIFLKNSKFSKAAAHYYCDKAKHTAVPSFLTRFFWTDPRPALLKQALAYDPEIAKKDAAIFIEHHLQQKQYQDAFSLLEVLSDNKLILKYLLCIPEDIRIGLIQKDSAIAAIMARYYIDKKQYHIALQLYTDLEKIDPNAAFIVALQERLYVKAYDIFCRFESTHRFVTSEKKKLSKIFFDAAETSYNEGYIYRDKKEWENAEGSYFQSLVQKKAAYHLVPDAGYREDVQTHKRLYAKLLIDADIDKNPAENSDIAQIQKALNLLRECRPDDKAEKHHLQNVLGKGLMRKADTLRQKICFEYTPHDHKSIREHKNLHWQTITTLIKTLKEVIHLLENTKDREQLQMLGKAHYLLADIQDFFDINAADINQHYKKAMQAVPENPFYIMRVSEVFEEEKDKWQVEGISRLKQMGYEVIDYVRWAEESWVKEASVIHTIKDIHHPPETANTSKWSFVI